MPPSMKKFATTHLAEDDPMTKPSNLRCHALDARDESADLFGTADGYLYRVNRDVCERVPMSVALARLGADWTLSGMSNESAPHPGVLFQDPHSVETVS